MSITAIEAALVARLQQQLVTAREAAFEAPLVRMVYAQADYAAIQESAMVTPSVAVIYTGYVLGATINPVGQIREVGFGWLIVVNVRNARNAATGEGVRADASPIFDATLEALLGWKPLPKFKPLQLEPAPGAAINDSGFGYYPLAFSTLATYRGNPA